MKQSIQILYKIKKYKKTHKKIKKQIEELIIIF